MHQIWAGGGAVCNGQSAQSMWTPLETQKNINELELLAVYFDLRSFLSLLKGKHVCIKSNNFTTVCYLNAMGATKSLLCNKIAKSVWMYCVKNEIWLIACHVPGVLNFEADKSSRQFNESIEWQLQPGIFLKVIDIHGTPEIDLFACRLNNQLPKYVSWKPDRRACHVDAFSFSWSGKFVYIFPSFSLLNRYLQKLENDQTLALLVAPVPADTGLVAPATKPSGGKSITAPTRQGPPHPSTIRDSTSSAKPNETDGMSVVRQYYETRGVSKSAVGLLMASWRGGTKKTYSGYIKKWTAFCLKRKVNHLQPLVVAVLDFFSELFDEGPTYSAINCAGSALSSYVHLDDGSVVGQNPLVCRLLKGVFQSRPPKPKYTEVWDVQVVLTYLAIPFILLNH